MAGAGGVSRETGPSTNRESVRSTHLASRTQVCTSAVLLLVLHEVPALTREGSHTGRSDNNVSITRRRCPCHITFAPLRCTCTDRPTTPKVYGDMIEDVAGRVPYMALMGNHERDWPRSGGVCAVLPLPLPPAAPPAWRESTALTGDSRGRRQGAKPSHVLYYMRSKRYLSLCCG